MSANSLSCANSFADRIAGVVFLILTDGERGWPNGSFSFLSVIVWLLSYNDTPELFRGILFIEVLDIDRRIRSPLSYPSLSLKAFYVGTKCRYRMSHTMRHTVCLYCIRCKVGIHYWRIVWTCFIYILVGCHGFKIICRLVSKPLEKAFPSRFFWLLFAWRSFFWFFFGLTQKQIDYKHARLKDPVNVAIKK